MDKYYLGQTVKIIGQGYGIVKAIIQNKGPAKYGVRGQNPDHIFDYYQEGQLNKTKLKV